MTHVVLDTQWLTFNIIGPTLAGNKFEPHLRKLPTQSSYTKDELEVFFKDTADFPTLSELLQTLDLMVTFDGSKFIIPAKVPEQQSSSPRPKFKKGRSIFCVDGKSMLSPTVFPVVQVRIMKELGSTGYQPIICKGSMQYSNQTVGLAKQFDEKDAINVAVEYNDGDAEASFNDLEKITGIIVTALYELSPGTAIETGKCPSSTLFNQVIKLFHSSSLLLLLMLLLLLLLLLMLLLLLLFKPIQNILILSL